jgi:membrane-associated phospholipid phosphatase
MLRLAAHVISYVFHPLLMPTMLFGVVSYFSPTIIQSAPWLTFIILAVFALTAVLPVLNILMFRMTGTVQNLHMPTQRERKAPFAFITVLYVGVTVLMYLKIPIPVVVKFMIISTALVAVVAIATFFMKISAHAVGIAGLTGILLALGAFSTATELIVPALVFLILAGVVMSSRLLLHAHTLEEVTWGGVVGFVVGFAGVLLLF